MNNEFKMNLKLDAEEAKRELDELSEKAEAASESLECLDIPSFTVKNNYNCTFHFYVGSGKNDL